MGTFCCAGAGGLRRCRFTLRTASLALSYFPARIGGLASQVTPVISETIAAICLRSSKVSPWAAWASHALQRLTVRSTSRVPASLSCLQPRVRAFIRSRLSWRSFMITAPPLSR